MFLFDNVISKFKQQYISYDPDWVFIFPRLQDRSGVVTSNQQSTIV